MIIDLMPSKLHFVIKVILAVDLDNLPQKNHALLQLLISVNFLIIVVDLLTPTLAGIHRGMHPRFRAIVSPSKIAVRSLESGRNSAPASPPSARIGARITTRLASRGRSKEPNCQTHRACL